MVVGCTESAAKAPPAKETAVLPTFPRANFGGDADRMAFAAALARCKAERTVADEIDKRYRADVATAKKIATDQAAAETKAAVEAAVAGIDPKDRRSVRSATADATRTAKAAGATKISDAQRAVVRQAVTAVTDELAKAYLDWLATDYAATVDGVVNLRFGPGWIARMQKTLDRERARITKVENAKPVVHKGDPLPPQRTREEIDAAIESHLGEVRCAQRQWVLNEFEGVIRAWAVGRREGVDFLTIPQAVAPLKGLAPTYVPPDADRVPIPASVQEPGNPMPPIAPEVALFLLELERSLAAAAPPQTFTAANYSGHGVGSWADKGFSLDLRLQSALDSRGFWQHSAAVSFLTAVNQVATALGARWRILYNDFGVAQEINAATGSRNVEFMGDSRGNLNWHGPAPMILHFHLDLEIPRGAHLPPPAVGQLTAP